LTAEQVPRLIDQIQNCAREAGASDIHLRPTEAGTEMRWRIDGVIQKVALFPGGIAGNIVARLKVLANLLTYRVDVPQEGRVQSSNAGKETRISVFPTQYGEKVVIRLFASSGHYDTITQLGLPDDIVEKFQYYLGQTSGVIVLTGPAGSGKTTTIYAALREIINNSRGERSLVSLEDPVEVIVPEVDQTSINAKSGMDMMTGLRSLVRQDPDVIMVGEIRDRETAETVFQASLIGNLVLTTFHAGSCTRSLSRLSDMGIEPYLLRSGLLAAFSQRLVRTLCDCKTISSDPEQLLSGRFKSVAIPEGCPNCRGTGHAGRRVISEVLDPELPAIAQAILNRQDVKQINEYAKQSGMISLRSRAETLVEAHEISPLEMVRVLGAV
ncbi:MAG: type II/IV secretion system protein, partial [Planctomycetaceae bacterium]|nr:type II/IV secretion system protein [Planctomycetaceae bacterium]